MNKLRLVRFVTLVTAATATSLAQTAAPVPTQAAAPPAPAGPTAMATPSMGPSLAANGKPTALDAGPLGTVYLTGVVSGFAQFGNHPVPGDRKQLADLDNGQVVVQTTSGPVQFYAQAGEYSIPDLGVPYLRADTATSSLYGPLPQYYIKLAPPSFGTFSLEVGKLPTLVGAEYTFSFENLNNERGLLWNQEPAVSRGVQAGYTAGPVALDLSWTDGYYSTHYDWLTASATWTINPSNTLALVGGGNASHATVSSYATPIYQNNGSIFNAIYTFTQGPWTVSPYYQYNSVPKSSRIGSRHKADASGFSVLVNYACDAKGPLAGVSLPGRVEYIASSGSAADGSPNLLYGAGSRAWSFTVTPTYQAGIFFARAELGLVTADRIAAGDAFGANGNSRTQSRFALETGVVF